MPPRKLVLVTGATGLQGGSAVNALIKRGHQVRGLTRNPNSENARALRARGVEVVVGDFEHLDSLIAAASGVNAVYGMTTMYEGGVQAETVHGKTLVEALKRSAVEHFVFCSVGAADQDTGVPHFESKYKVEEHIRESGLNYTIIGPAFFMENYLSPWYLPGILEGKLVLPVPSETSLQHVSVEDIGNFAAVLIERGEPVYEHRYDIAGDELTGPEAAEALGRATGIKTTYSSPFRADLKVLRAFPAAAVREYDEDFLLMVDWFSRVGYSADIDGLRKEFPEVGWSKFADWANRQDWLQTPE